MITMTQLYKRPVRTSSTALWFFVLMLALGCGKKSVDFAAVTKVLNDKVAEFETALNQGNLASFAVMFKDDAKLTRPDGTYFEGKAAIENWAREAFAIYAIETELSSDKLLIYPRGKRAFYRGVYHLNRQLKDGGEIEKESGWYRLFWHKMPDSDWKIYRLNWLNAPTKNEDEDAF